MNSKQDNVNNVVVDTGERMLPEISDSQVLCEHIYRYRFATNYVKGLRVLDIACGEGYGSAAMQASGAKSVVGMDISDDVCLRAREKYKIDARVANAMSIPLAAGAVDIVVSFETIEHVIKPNIFVKECSRVLQKSGTLIISTPNVATYNPSRSPASNPFHCSEMTGIEFVTLLKSHFHTVKLFSQCIVSAPAYSFYEFLSRNSRWRKFRGYHRLVGSHFPDASSESICQLRTSIIHAVIHKENFITRLFNPYTVRRYSLDSSIIPLYLVAVASDPIR